MKIQVELNLSGSFPEMFLKHMPSNVDQNGYVTAIVESWLIDKDTKERKE